MTEVQDLHVELQILPEWSRIDPVRQAVGLCVEAVFGNEDLRDALGMVCAELLENAIKYGKPAPHKVRLVLSNSEQPQRHEVTLSVINAVDEASHHVELLQQRIGWIQRFDSSAEAYMAALTLVYERAEAQGGEGGLGLVRIAYEGGCRLDCDCPEQGVMAVHARYTLPRTEVSP
jgi:hypothetical protein